MPKGIYKDQTKPRYWLGKKHDKETKEKMKQTRNTLIKEGKLFSEETKKRMSESGKKKVLSKEHKRKISLSLIGNKRNLGHHHTKESKDRMSIKLSGKNNPSYGKTTMPKYPKSNYYKNIYMRSSWEIIYAKWLDRNGFHWKYEPKRFHFEEKGYTYLPDFWVDEFNSYIEIKGFMTDLAQEKIELFSKYHPLILIKDIRSYMEKLKKGYY